MLWLDTSPAAETDDLERTVDYGSLGARLAEIVAGEPVALIETLAQRLAAACLADDLVQHAEITVHKPQAPGRGAGARRQRHDQAEPFADAESEHRGGRSPVTSPARQVVLALGSNLGDRLATIQAGIDDLAVAPGIALRSVSAVFETSPVGGPDQPRLSQRRPARRQRAAWPGDPAAHPGGRARPGQGADRAVGTPHPRHRHHCLRRRDQR